MKTLIPVTAAPVGIAIRIYYKLKFMLNTSKLTHSFNIAIVTKGFQRWTK